MMPINCSNPWPAFGLGTAALPHRQMSVEQLTSLMTSALQHGVKLFDTAANYYEGQAEQCLADAMVQQHSISDFKAVNGWTVVSKIGQLTQGECNQRRKVYGSMGIKHWDFSSGYIMETLDRSIERLGKCPQKYILLHNPEDAYAALGSDLSALDDACAILEQAARNRRIIGWGLSSWFGLYATPGSPEHLDLASLLNRLDTIFGTHHCKIVQAPMGLWNLPQFNAAHQRRRRDGQATTLMGFCQDEDLQIMLNAAFDGGRWSPHQAEDPELREYNKADILRLCNEEAPSACRIVGASQSATIESLMSIYHDR